LKCALCYIVCMVITSEQIRATRGLLRLEQDELARRASVSVVTVRRLEAANGHTRELEALGAWLIEHGVTYVGMESTGVYWKVAP